MKINAAFLTFTLLALLGAQARASCPKTKKEWESRGVKIFLEKASKQRTTIELPNFSNKLGKSAQGRAIPYKQQKTQFALVQAEDKETKLYLSGVLKCASPKQDPVLASLTWIKEGKSGLVKVVEP